MSRLQQITNINNLLKSHYKCLLYHCYPFGNDIQLNISTITKPCVIGYLQDSSESWPELFNTEFYDITSDTFNFQFEKLLKFITALNTIFSDNGSKYTVRWFDKSVDGEYSVCMTLSLEVDKQFDVHIREFVVCVFSTDFDRFITEIIIIINNKWEQWGKLLLGRYKW